MTIHQAIEQCDMLQGNPYGNREKLLWLSTLEAKIWEEIISRYEKKRKKPVFDGWGDRDMGKTLLAEPPFDELYVLYLTAQVDFHNGEMNRYNNAAARFNQAFAEFARHYNRTHMPKTDNIQNY
ncbi:MAG: hypothetical protein FWE80_06165 [Oscillospiraceae bacterium]|nr:hypothetical protein [Oscillospiraceae bacterium]